MIELTKAIYNRYFEELGAVNELKALIGDRFYEAQAEDGAAYPYVVYFVIGSVRDWTFSGGEDEVSVQFSIYNNGNTADTNKLIYKALKDAFDFCELDVDEGEVVYMKLTGSTGFGKSDEIYQTDMDFEISMLD